MFKGSVLGSKSPLQHLAVADYHAEQIVEVVRDSSGKPPDCFHFLRHAELPFQGAPLCRVLGKNLDISDCASLILYGTTAAPYSNESTIFSLPLHFNVFETFLMQKRFIELLMFNGITINASGEIRSEKLLFETEADHFLQGQIA